MADFAVRAFRVVNAQDKQRNGDACGNYGNPQHRSNIVCKPYHEDQGGQRADNCTQRVQGLTESIRRPAQIARCNVCYQGVTGSPADTLADSIDEPRPEYPADGGRQRKNRLG